MLFKQSFYNSLSLLFFLVLPLAEAAAQEAPPAEIPPPSFATSFAEMAPMFAIVFLIFYMMVVKPQQKKAKEQEDLIKNLAKGATVLTSSGMIGRVAGIEKDYILLELATNVKVRFQPSHIVKSIDATAGKEGQPG